MERRATAADRRHARAVHGGREHLRAQDPVAAERSFREALRQRPGDAVALSGLGHCLRLQQREQEAVRALHAAVEALRTRGQPGIDEALLDIAFELQEALAPAASLALVDEILARDAVQARAWHLRARACQRLLRVEEGLTAARRATELAPGTGNAQLLRAELEQAAGDLEAARERLATIAGAPARRRIRSAYEPCACSVPYTMLPDVMRKPLPACATRVCR